MRVLLDDTVPAGVHSVRVRERSARGARRLAALRVVAASNALPIVVRPSVAVTDIDDDDVTLTVSPPIQAGQRATVVLGRLDAAAPDDPTDLTLVLPPADAPQATLAVPREEIPDGRWLVRVQVDGVDSLPEIVGETYGAPALTFRRHDRDRRGRLADGQPRPARGRARRRPGAAARGRGRPARRRRSTTRAWRPSRRASA